MNASIRVGVIVFTVALLNAIAMIPGSLYGPNHVFADTQNPLDDHLPAGEVTDTRATKTYDSIKSTLAENYAKSLLAAASSYNSWRRYNKAPYVSEHHGGRLVNDYANSAATNYGNLENGDRLPAGSIVAMDSFRIIPSCLPLTITADAVDPGPLFVMEKLDPGFNEETGDWRFTMVMPDGSIYGETNGIGHEQVQFCADCHQDVSKKQDWLFFLPKKYRLLAENSSAASE